MILHIEAGHRRNTFGGLVDCLIITDQEGGHVAATPGNDLSDWLCADLICAAVNGRDQARAALTAADDAIAALPKLDAEAIEESNAATAAIARALDALKANPPPVSPS
ncbi:MAG: hypothetical protein AB7F22_25555 [Reyranella sp.]|uniref:hypothetical protein n=1 Tax=Reyranella sp. TaxID=1929291 RepID=UPI003D1276E3